MIKIFKHSSDAVYILPFGGVDNYAAIGVGHVRWLPLVGPYNPRTLEASEDLYDTIDGSITTGPSDIVGDRSCTHRALEGDVHYLPFAFTDITEAKELRQCFSAVGSLLGPTSQKKETVWFSDVVSPGEDIVHSIPFREKNSYGYWYYGTYTLRAFMKGNASLVGWALEYFQCDKAGIPLRSYRDIVLINTSYSSDFFKASYTYVINSHNVSSLEYASLLKKFTSVLPHYVSATSAADKYSFAYVPFKDTCRNDIMSLKKLTSTGQFLPDLVTDDKFVWGDLCQQCIDKANYVNVNVLQFIHEFRNIKKLLPKIGKVRDPKTWANAYLWFRYGLTLTIKDMRQLSDAISSMLTDSHNYDYWTARRLYASKSLLVNLGKYVASVSYHYKITYAPYPSLVMNIINETRKWGIYPTLKNAWDFIPYSFVVDWFISVQDMLGQLDEYINYQYFDVRAVCKSRKCSITVPVRSLLSSTSSIGYVVETAYDRRVKPTLDLPRVRLGLPSGFHNYAEFTALLVQRYHR